MKTFRIGDKVVLDKDQSYDYLDDNGDKVFDTVYAGTKGTISNIVQIDKEVLILFHPDAESRIFAIDVKNFSK